MRTKNYLYLLFILVGCATQPLVTSPDPLLIPVSNNTVLNDNYEVRVDYKELKSQNHEFEVFIANQSNDSVFVDPASFTYRLISEENRKKTTSVYSINPKEKIKQLEMHQDSLMNDKNPHSLSDKSVKEIATQGLVAGTIGLLFGRSAEELESQRREEEDEWEREHNLQLDKINEELSFWRNKVLLPQMVPPNKEISGRVLFPDSLDTKEIEIGIPIQNNVFKLRFKQSS